MMDTPKTLGNHAEQRAYQHLAERGLTLLDKNFHSPFGEIDLIMQEGEDIIFIEVRLKNNTAFGTSIESVNSFKQKKIIKTALCYLKNKRLLNQVNCRFDIIGISPTETTWIKNAFGVGFV